MRKRDTSDVLVSVLAMIADACAIFAGFALATWIRFYSGWVPVFKGQPPNLRVLYLTGAGVATLLFLFILSSLELYVRPQTGTFGSKVPRLVRSIGLGMLLTAAVGFLVKTDPPFSTGVLLIALFTVTFLVLLERYLLHEAEIIHARHAPAINRVAILGTDDVAARLKRSLTKEPRLRSEVVAFVRTDLSESHKEIPPKLVKGTVAELARVLEEEPVDQVILTNSSMGHERIVDLILFCERNLIQFNMVPDVFRILTGGMNVQTIDDIPLLGVSEWPLDIFWSRMLKRVEDVIGSLAGLLLAAPLIAIAACFIKRSSPGPVFYRQERCGEKGKPFMLYKLRTMAQDAEVSSGPVFTAEDDPRRTKTGTFLRRHNLDELPQLWNVLKGDMSLVGPRPERPHFVEKFKEDISRYMWRHVSKPGLTGWAQVNGFRGNTSISERIKYDLYYLENWSLAFDFKILIKTFFARENAY